MYSEVNLSSSTARTGFILAFPTLFGVGELMLTSCLVCLIMVDEWWEDEEQLNCSLKCYAYRFSLLGLGWIIVLLFQKLSQKFLSN